MRLGLLTGAATALLLIGAAGAQAETIYVTQPNVIETAPGYVYSAPIVTEPGYAVVPPDYVMVAPQPGYVVDRPVAVAPRATYGYRDYRVAPRRRGIVTTGYSTTPCSIDAFGYERCY